MGHSTIIRQLHSSTFVWFHINKQLICLCFNRVAQKCQYKNSSEKLDFNFLLLNIMKVMIVVWLNIKI